MEATVFLRACVRACLLTRVCTCVLVGGPSALCWRSPVLWNNKFSTADSYPSIKATVSLGPLLMKPIILPPSVAVAMELRRSISNTDIQVTASKISYTFGGTGCQSRLSVHSCKKCILRHDYYNLHVSAEASRGLRFNHFRDGCCIVVSLHAWKCSGLCMHCVLSQHKWNQKELRWAGASFLQKHYCEEMFKKKRGGGMDRDWQCVKRGGTYWPLVIYQTKKKKTNRLNRMGGKAEHAFNTKRADLQHQHIQPVN